jgi:2-oxo-4-hydroxy-4-carboxy--5-ureidoimidazoline (OHCU) decarboxylase
VPSAGRSIAEVDGLTPDQCVATLAPLFEGAPRFLARLCAVRPFADADSLFEAARRIARAMPADEQVELIDAHPRLGAPAGSVSAASFVEQGYDRDQAEDHANVERDRLAVELERLNAAYEARFGFRYCVFVAGRPPAALVPDFEAALSGDPATERTRGLDAVIDIAADRWRGRAGD